MLAGVGGLLRTALSGGCTAAAAGGGVTGAVGSTSLGLPAGAVITNLGVLNGGQNTG
jgi:hypothetical protein